jgi:hypothetical protein
MQTAKRSPAADVANNTQRTVSGILWGKFLTTIEESTWVEMFWTVMKIISSILIATLLYNIREAGAILATWMRWHDLAIPKTILAVALSFGWRIWARWLVWIWDEISGSIDRAISEMKKRTKEDIPKWYGIPVVEIAEHLFSGDGSFRRDDIERKFAIPRNQFDKMVKEMDVVNIFVRAENNSRKLNPDFSRSDISSMLINASERGELQPLHRKNGESSWTSEPSMPELLSTPPPANGFVISEIPKIAS